MQEDNTARKYCGINMIQLTINFMQSLCQFSSSFFAADAKLLEAYSVGYRQSPHRGSHLIRDVSW